MFGYFLVLLLSHEGIINECVAIDAGVASLRRRICWSEMDASHCSSNIIYYMLDTQNYGPAHWGLKK